MASRRLHALNELFPLLIQKMKRDFLYFFGIWSCPPEPQTSPSLLYLAPMINLAKTESWFKTLLPPVMAHLTGESYYLLGQNNNIFVFKSKWNCQCGWRPRFLMPIKKTRKAYRTSFILLSKSCLPSICNNTYYMTWMYMTGSVRKDIRVLKNDF